MLSDFTKLLIVSVKQNLLIFVNGISKRNTGFLNRQRFVDSNLSSEMSSRRVKATPLIKRACRSSFIPVNGRTVYRMLKRKLGSAPPI